MTRPSSSLPLQPACARQRHRASLLGCSLGCLVAGCAERYDIGEFRDTTLLQTGDVAPAGIGVLLADGIEDADALLEGVRFLSSTSGDLDGDGFDDLVVAGTELPTSLHILYGGPRPSDRVVRLARRSSALGLDEYYYSASPDGDFDRDGADDLVVSARDRGFYEYGLSGTAAAEQEVEWANLVQRWTEMRAFLWNGRPERPAQLEFPGDAAAFRAGDDLSSNLARVLEEHAPNEFAASFNVGFQLDWLGDVDGDGHGDLALSTSFDVVWSYEETPSEAASSVPRTHAESVSYLYYGGAPLEVGGEVRPPDARLPGLLLTGLGDVNGDGLADVVAVAGDGSRQLDIEAPPPQYLFPGSTQRLAGEVSVQDLGVPVQISSLRPLHGVGDLDGDGIGDLLSWRVYDRNQSSFDLVYGSPDLLQRPLDATQVSATFAGRAHQYELYQGGDYDGDGMSELLLYTTFWKGDGSGAPPTLEFESDQARLIPGSTSRYAGTYDLDVIQPSREARPGELYAVIPAPAGDFDGDGRGDVVLTNGLDVRIKFGAGLQPQSQVRPGHREPPQPIR